MVRYGNIDEMKQLLPVSLTVTLLDNEFPFVLFIDITNAIEWFRKLGSFLQIYIYLYIKYIYTCIYIYGYQAYIYTQYIIYT